MVRVLYKRKKKRIRRLSEFFPDHEFKNYIIEDINVGDFVVKGMVQNLAFVIHVYQKKGAVVHRVLAKSVDGYVLAVNEREYDHGQV